MKKIKKPSPDTHTTSDIKYKTRPSLMVLDFAANSLQVQPVCQPYEEEVAITPRPQRNVIKKQPVSPIKDKRKPAKVLVSVATQTEDYIEESRDGGFLEFCRQEYETPAQVKDTFDERCDKEMASMTWLAGLESLSSYAHYRPTSPDADMMQIGKRLGFVDDSPFQSDNNSDPDEDEEIHFEIYPLANLPKPVARRVAPYEKVPLSPSISERTVPSDIGSESSKTGSTRTHSLPSSPDISLLHDDALGAFFPVMQVKSSLSQIQEDQ